MTRRFSAAVAISLRKAERCIADLSFIRL